MMSTRQPVPSRRPVLRCSGAGVLAIMLITLVAALGVPVGAAGPAVLVKDINPGPGSSLGQVTSDPWVAARGRLFFPAADGVHGVELWTSDGTAEGTVLLKDIRIGADRSSIVLLTNVDDTIFFSADDGVHGQELWKSDGTPEGTTIVTDIFPGLDPSNPIYLTNVNGTLFFIAQDFNGWGLWKSDGTAAGTVLLKRRSLPINYLTSVGAGMFYVSDGSQVGDEHELWYSDGTATGTELVKSFAPGRATRLAATGNLLFFISYRSKGSFELWRSDGTAAGTSLLGELGPPTDPRFHAVGNTMYILYILTFEGDQRAILWKSDGTTAGTIQLKDFSQETPAYPTPSGSLVDVDGTLVFGLYGPYLPLGIQTGALWKSDGTATGTVPLKEQILPIGAATVCGQVFFSAGRHVSGSATTVVDAELWQSDGTSDGTFQIQDIAPGDASSVPSYLIAVGHTLFFDADDGSSGEELWALPISRAGAPGPTPSIPLPHHVFLPYAQSEASC